MKILKKMALLSACLAMLVSTLRLNTLAMVDWEAHECPACHKMTLKISVVEDRKHAEEEHRPCIHDKHQPSTLYDYFLEYDVTEYSECQSCGYFSQRSWEQEQMTYCEYSKQ